MPAARLAWPRMTESVQSLPLGPGKPSSLSRAIARAGDLGELPEDAPDDFRFGLVDGALAPDRFASRVVALHHAVTVAAPAARLTGLDPAPQAYAGAIALLPELPRTAQDTLVPPPRREGCPAPEGRDQGSRTRPLAVHPHRAIQTGVTTMSATNIGDEHRRASLEFPPQCREMIRRGALVALNIALMQEVPELSVLPVIFISAYGRDETVARTLEAGAADYIVKPFSPTELVARVRAVLRRHDEPEPIVLGALAIDYGRRRVTVAGDAVDLTPTEYELLRVLSLDAGRVMTYDTLLRRVWSGRHGADANLVLIVVRNLRRKLGDDAADPVWIFNQRGVGYRMAEPRAGTHDGLPCVPHARRRAHGPATPRKRSSGPVPQVIRNRRRRAVSRGAREPSTAVGACARTLIAHPARPPPPSFIGQGGSYSGA